MEQKKLLWIIFSAIGFVLIIAVVGLIWFWPQDKTAGKQVTLQTGKEKKDFDPIEWVRESGDYPGLEQPSDKEKSGDFTIVYGESEKAQEKAKQTQPEGGSPLPETAKDGLPLEPPAGNTEGSADTGKDRIKIEVYNPKEKKKTVEATASAPAPKPKSSTPKTVRVREYWIQTGSYTSMARAEEVKDRLSEKGVASVITSKMVDSTNYYRVRIGPYENKAEADKFLGWIQGINGFESSYVSLVYSHKAIN